MEMIFHSRAIKSHLHKKGCAHGLILQVRVFLELGSGLLSLNLKHELRSKRSKAILYHADIPKRYFLVCHLKIVFNFLHELKRKD